MNKRLEKYFSLSDTMYLVGGCLLVVAFFFIWLGLSYNYWMFIAGIPVFAVGLTMFIVGSIGRIGAEDIDRARDVRLENFSRELLEDVHLAKRMSEHMETSYVTQYDYVGEGIESRRGRDGVWRTSIVSAFRIFYLHDGLLINRLSFSVLGDGKEAHTVCEYKFDQLDRAAIEQMQVRLASGKNTYTVNRAELVIYAKDGSEALRSQVPDDMDSEHIAESINRLIEHGEAL